MRARFAIAGLVALTSCWEPPSFEGRECDSDGACPAGFTCVSGSCRSDPNNPIVDSGTVVDSATDGALPDAGTDASPDVDAGSDDATEPDAETDAGVPVCGNGAIEAGEACDDENVTDGDGCSGFCAVESGYECAQSPSQCAPICGDGRRLGDEQCDDGPAADGDGCSADCTVEPGFVCPRSPSVCETADPDLLAFLDFDDEPGTIAMDVTGNGHIGTVVGDAGQVAGPQGLGSRALEIDGIDDYVRLDDFDYGQDFTFVMWARIPTATVSPLYHVLVQHGYTPTNRGVQIRVDNAGVTAMRTRDGDISFGVATQPGRYDPADWHQYAVVYRAAIGRTDGFVDGAYQGGEIGPLGSFDAVGTIALGTDPRIIDDTRLTGAIDEFRVYERALTQSELLSLHHVESSTRVAALGARHDAMVRGGIYGDINHDVTSMDVKVGNLADFNREALMRFDLSGVTGVTSAQLHFTYGRVGIVGLQHGIAVLADDAWDQTTVTWNNRPPSGPDVAMWSLPLSNESYSIDVTASVQAESNGDGSISFAIRSLTDLGGDGVAAYISRENSNGPYLFVTY